MFTLANHFIIMSISTLFLLILIGMCAGVLSGVVGVGGGIIIIPLLMLLIGLDQHQAQGTSLAVMLPPIGILAAINYHKAGFIDWKYAMIIATAFIVGGYFGSKFGSEKFSQKIVQNMLVTVMLIAAVRQILELLGLWM